MRRPPLVAALALLGALLTATFLPAALVAKPCPKGTTVVGSTTKPSACLPKGPTSQVTALERAVVAARKPGTKGRKPSKRVAKLLREALAFAQSRVAAGEPILTADRAGLAGGGAPRRRSARRLAAASGNATVTNAPASFGHQVTTTVDSNANIRTEFKSGDVSLEMAATANEFSMDIRDRSGAGGFFKLGTGSHSPLPNCPTAEGDVPSKFDLRITFGQATAEHGKREWVSITTIFDGPWKGHVGVSGKSETYDASLRGALEVRSGQEIAATGKVLRRDRTYTYRATLDRSAIPIGTPGQPLAAAARYHGPKGAIRSSFDRTMSSQLATLVAQQFDLVADQLRFGDTRWYDKRMCARAVVQQYAPEEVSKGQTADWQLRATDASGVTVADAQWTVSSTCGQLAAEQTRGPILKARVADVAGDWGPDPYRPGCISAEFTSTAGRAHVLTHSIEPKKPDGLKFSIEVTYNENMGSGITETNMTGRGSVFLRWDETDAEGVGTLEGTEWDGTIANPCGENMSASRSFDDTATVGVHRNRDGTFSVAFVADHRPLRMGFLAIVPAEGGDQTTTGAQPFCGEAKRAKTTTQLKVMSVAVPADG